jgi:hypothetical protein
VFHHSATSAHNPMYWDKAVSAINFASPSSLPERPDVIRLDVARAATFSGAVC